MTSKQFGEALSKEHESGNLHGYDAYFISGPIARVVKLALYDVEERDLEARKRAIVAPLLRPTAIDYNMATPEELEHAMNNRVFINNLPKK